MSIVQIQTPDSLQKSLYDVAGRDGISIDQFTSTTMAEKLMTDPRLSNFGVCRIYVIVIVAIIISVVLQNRYL